MPRTSPINRMSPIARILLSGPAILLLVTLAAPPTSAAPRVQSDPQPQSKAELDAYSALYYETDTAAKIGLAEAFLVDYPESEFLALTYMNLINAYQADMDWAMLLDASDRFDTGVENPDQTSREFVYPRAMLAAQNLNDVGATIRFGQLLLEVAPNNLGAMLTLGTVYMDNLPASDPARGRALTEAYDLANRARVQAQSVYANQPEASVDRTRVLITVHTTLARVHYARSDFQRAADEYLQVVSLSPNDGDAYYRLGDSYQFLAVEASREVQATLAARDEAISQGREEAILDQLDARFEALQSNVLAYLDRSIDFFATAVAIGGTIGPEARIRLEPLYRNRHEDSLDGLDALIERKAAALRTP